MNGPIFTTVEVPADFDLTPELRAEIVARVEAKMSALMEERHAEWLAEQKARWEAMAPNGENPDALHAGAYLPVVPTYTLVGPDAYAVEFTARLKAAAAKRTLVWTGEATVPGVDGEPRTARFELWSNGDVMLLRPGRSARQQTRPEVLYAVQVAAEQAGAL